MRGKRKVFMLYIPFQITWWREIAIPDMSLVIVSFLTTLSLSYFLSSSLSISVREKRESEESERVRFPSHFLSSDSFHEHQTHTQCQCGQRGEGRKREGRRNEWNYGLGKVGGKVTRPTRYSYRPIFSLSSLESFLSLEFSLTSVLIPMQVEQWK